MTQTKLSVGQFGVEVASVHSALAQSGLQLPASEVSRQFFGPATRQAVQQLQRNNQLPVTGEVDTATMAVLAPAAMQPGTPAATVASSAAPAAPPTGSGTLKPGSSGPDVKLLQDTIGAIGIELNESETKENRFGNTTYDADRRLQVLSGLSPTGEVSEPVFGILKAAYGRLQLPGGPGNILPSGSCTVTGTVTDSNGLPMPLVTVVAKVQSLRDLREIGRAGTTAGGDAASTTSIPRRASAPVRQPPGRSSPRAPAAA